jgi:AraC-like DNA-binding protein
MSDPAVTMDGMASVYRERRAHPALRGLLDCVWTQTVGPDEHLQRVIPDGCIDLIWLDGRLELAGPDTEPRCVQLNPGSMIAGVRLRPGAAGLLLDSVPASEVRDHQLDLADLWGSRARPLAGRLADAAGPESAAAMLEATALARLSRFTRDFAIESAVARLRRTPPPTLPVLAEGLGTSERQLRRRFVETVGYGPKTLSMILRLRHALRLGVGRGGLAELAATTGYADQAHLSREVRRLTGLTPLAWFAPPGRAQS